MKKILLALLIIFTISCETPQLTYYVPVEEEYFGYQLEMLHEVNADRIANGLNALIPEKNLTLIAKDYATVLDSTQIYNHRFFMTRFAESGAKYFGEVIAIGFNTSTSEMSAFQNSTSHINVLRNKIYKYIAVYKINRCVVIELAKFH
tara:strand:- start:31 stop:474 length:444 start_codon:yes stop_codon:yes gene_type:complete